MNNTEWENAKKDIRSILIPIQKGCTLTEFKKEYMGMIGQKLPAAKFGFATDVDLLLSMPDVVRLSSYGYGEYHLMGIADETTRHIQKMVVKQKPQKRKPQRNPPRPARWREAPPRFQFQQVAVRKVLPVMLQANIVHLVQMFPAGLSLTDFLMFFERCYREKFLFRNFGFFTLDECIQTIPNLVMKTVNNDIFIHFVGTQPKAKMFVPPSIPRFKEPEVSNGKIKNSPVPSVKAVPDFQPSAMDKKFPLVDNIRDKGSANVTPLPTIPKGMKMSYSIVENPKEPQHLNVPEPKGENLLSSKSKASIKTEDAVPNVSSGSPKVDISNTVHHENGEPEAIPPFVLKNLKKIADIYREGIWATDFPALYEDIIRTEFDLHSLGYNDLSLFIDAVPDIFKREDVVGVRKNWLIYPADSSKGETKSTLPNSSAILMESIITNAKQMLQAYPEGIKLEEFLHIYSINCSEPLYIKDLGFSSIESFLLSIASRVPLMIASSIDGKTVHLVEPPAARVFQFAPNTEVPEPLPTDIVLPNTRLETVKLGPDFDYSKYFPIYTTSIESPGLLYIQLKGPQNSEVMHKLYDEMEVFYYSQESSKYKMKNAHIRVGAVCAALWPYDNHWYRVEIVSIPSLEYVKVFYFDYGTKEEIPTNMLRYLKQQYAELPAQALLSSLACLKPSQQAAVWDPRARLRMLRLCLDISLMACIDSVTEDGVLSLILCDTNGEKDVYINDILLNEGLADSIAAPDPPPPQDVLAQLQAQLLMQANFVKTLQGFSYNASAAAFSRPPVAPSVGYVPPPMPFEAYPPGFNSCTAAAPAETISPTESEVFGDDDDDVFNQFYKKVVTVMKRYVKRIRTSDGYIFHILKLNGLPYVSSGDISSLIWSAQDSEYLVQRLQNREVILPSKIISEVDNKDIFHQIRRFFVKGCQRDSKVSQILVYSLDSVIEILNLFGQPSAELRKRIQSELASFNPRHAEWQELSEAEIPEEEEVSVATDDDKLNRLCLYDLLAMKESIRLRRSEKMKDFMNPKVDEVVKMEHLLEKVIERIEQIKQICNNFKYIRL